MTARNLVPEEEVIGVLRGFNPWWLSHRVDAAAFRRMPFYEVRRYVADAGFKRALLLTGPRRVGKTTLLIQLVGEFLTRGLDPTAICYLSLDHPVLKLMRLDEVLRLYHETIRPKGEPCVLLLDEIQYSREWELEVKQLVDRGSHYRIVATGSAMVTQKGIAESGVGRWVRVSVPPLSFYEYLQIVGEAPRTPLTLRPSQCAKLSSSRRADLVAQLAPLRRGFNQYLLRGGFPEVALETDARRGQRILREDIVERVLKRDMTMLFGVRNPDLLERLFLYICRFSGSLFSIEATSSQLGTSRATVASYLQSLEQAHLIYRLRSYGHGGKTQLRAQEKVYLVDAALRNAVMLRGEEVLESPEEMGALVENATLRHLYAYHYRDSPRLGYWRDSRSGKEVDMVISSPAYVVPVEVKYQSNATVRANSGLADFCRQEKIRLGFWVTRDDRDFDVVPAPDSESEILRIPAHIFLYLLGEAEERQAKGTS